MISRRGPTVKIEILLADISKKTEVLTHLAKDQRLQAKGNELEVNGLKLETGESYLLFTITNWERAEEIVPLLFAIKPAYSAHTFRLESGLKALVTCPARPIPDIIPELSSVTHLDLEKGELAGDFQVTWTSHDVAVSAQATLMVQGGLAVTKIKFATHSRDTEYHCRACLNMISFKEILGVFCREPLEVPVEPVIGPIVIKGRAIAEGDGWSEFVNERAGVPTAYDRATGELKLALGPDSYISFREGKGKTKEVLVYMESAEFFTDSLAAEALRLLGLTEVKFHREIRDVILDLGRLRQELDFQLGSGLSEFIRSGEFSARYDAGRLELTFEAEVPLDSLPVQERLVRIYQEIEAFTGRVMVCAV